MIGKLRRKMIFLVMSTVTVLLLTVFLVLYHFSAVEFESKSMESLQMAVREDQKAEPGENLREDLVDNQRENPPGSMNEDPGEAPPPPEPVKGGKMEPLQGREQRPVLVLEKGTDGSVNIVKNTLYSSSSDTPDVESLFEAAAETGKEEGKLEVEHLRFFRDENMPGGKERCAFSDTYSEEQSLKKQAETSIVAFCGAFLAFFFFAVWFSHWAVGPVEEAWEKQKQFIADASHELKTPLAVIMSNAGLLAQSGEIRSENDLRHISYIQEESKRMKQLLEELLFLARSDAGKQAVQMKEVDITYLLESSTLLFEPVAFESGKTIHTEIEPGVSILGDKNRLKQLAEILLDNACKYGKAESVINLKMTRCSDKKVRFSVTSQGTPLTKKQREQIFERFYRTDPSRGKTEGYGLGLAIAKEIVTLHKGKIWVEAAEGNQFIVKLPTGKM